MHTGFVRRIVPENQVGIGSLLVQKSQNRALSTVVRHGNNLVHPESLSFDELLDIQ